MNILEPWHRITSEEELEYFVRGGWTEFTVRPNGSIEYVFLNEDLFNRQLAQLCTTGFKRKWHPGWVTFRDIVYATKHGQVCVPGPLSAHEMAMVEVGKQKSKNRSTPSKRLMPWDFPSLY